jgi:peptide chain release factor 2
LKNLRKKSWTSGGVFDASALEKSIKEKESLSSAPDFWNDSAKAGRIFASIKQAKERLETWKSLRADISNLQEFVAMALEEDQGGLEGDIRQNYQDIKERFDKAVVLELLSGEADPSDAYVSIHAGSGGTEACDWASMLLRMYTRWAERRGFSTELIDLLEAEGGVKSATLQISGSYAYGYLRGESGVHRLVRISPFDANARRHTSSPLSTCCRCWTIPSPSIYGRGYPYSIPTEPGARGARRSTRPRLGGTHNPLETGIVVTSRTSGASTNKGRGHERAQVQIVRILSPGKEKENEKYQSDKKEIAWGSQIRSYVFQPYTLVKDQEPSFSLGNVQAVMDGDIDPFIENICVGGGRAGSPLWTADDEEV